MFDVVTGVPGKPTIIEASTNLLDWQTLATLLATNNILDFRDTSAGGMAQRFFRAVTLP